MKHIIFIALLILISCTGYGNECSKYNNMSSFEIDQLLSKMDKTPLSHEIYLLGECRVQSALPVLNKYIDDKRVTHHALHKGMTIGNIARGAIAKVTETKQNQ